MCRHRVVDDMMLQAWDWVNKGEVGISFVG
jgi:hypothetical protein